MRLIELKETVQWDTSKVMYRGMSAEHDAVTHRSGYAIFVTDNIHQAAGYAGPKGKIAEMHLHPSEVQQAAGGMRFSPSKFDDQATQLSPGTILVALDVVDNGPYMDELPSNKHTYGSTHVAFRHQSIAKVIRLIEAAQFFEVESHQ